MQERSITAQIAAIEETLRRALPPIFTRRTAERLTGKLVDAGSLANLDSAGEGPPRFRYGQRVGYERDQFIAWFVERLRGQATVDGRESTAGARRARGAKVSA